MPFQRSNTADKFIVDRRKTRRNSDVSRAVRKTRDRLSQQAGNPAFERELLKLHARAMINSATAIPLLVLLISAAGLFFGMSRDILIWALMTVICYAGLALVAQRVNRADARRYEVGATRALFPGRSFPQRHRLDLFRRRSTATSAASTSFPFSKLSCCCSQSRRQR